MIVNIETYSDADFQASFSYRTPQGTAINLGTDSLRMMVRTRAEDATAHFECSTENGRIIVTDAVNGAFTLRIPLDVLIRLAPGLYVHSLIKTQQLTFIRKEIWRGTLTHAAGPTRWTLNTL